MLTQLTLDQLRILASIVDEGSFSAAGRRLGRVQSAISHAVRNLEEANGVTLFDRSSRRPELTAEGRVLVEQARRVLAQVDTYERMAGAMAAGLEPQLTIAIDPFVPTPAVIDLLAGLRQAFPDIAVTLYTEGIGAAERRIVSGSAIIGICALNPFAPVTVQAFRVGSIDMVPVAAKGHPLARKAAPLDPEDLAEHVQLVLTDPLESTGPNFNVVSPTVWRFVDIGRRLDFLLGGFGWGFMPHYLVREHIAAGRLFKLRLSDANIVLGAIDVSVIHDHSRTPGRAAQWLLTKMREPNWHETFAGGLPASSDEKLRHSVQQNT